MTRSALFVALALLSSGCVFADKAGRSCSSDDQCSANAECSGGYCTGGTCRDSACDRGWECQREDGVLLDNHVCRLPCDADDDCPDTWGCGASGFCSLRGLVAEIVAESNRVAPNAPYVLTVDVISSAGEPSFEWRIEDERLEYDRLDAPSITLRSSEADTAPYSVFVAVSSQWNRTMFVYHQFHVLP